MASTTDNNRSNGQNRSWHSEASVVRALRSMRAFSEIRRSAIEQLAKLPQLSNETVEGRTLVEIHDRQANARIKGPLRLCELQFGSVVPHGRSGPISVDHLETLRRLAKFELIVLSDTLTNYELATVDITEIGRSVARELKDEGKNPGHYLRA